MSKSLRNMIATIVVLIVCPLYLSLLPVAITFADGPVTDDTIFRVSITDFLTLTIDETNNTAHITPQNRFSSGSVVAGVATNNGTGYRLSIIDADERNGLERAGYTTASNEDKPLYNIASVSADTTYANLADDSWGYFLGSTNPTEATYKQIPLESTEISSSDSPTASAESTTVSFGVKTAATRPSGTYEDTVVFSAVAIPLPPDICAPNATTISEAVCMQDMNSNVIDSMVTERQYQLRDSRDDKMYWISRLADGNVWMTQNLDFNIPATALTSENTDLTYFGDKGYDAAHNYSKDVSTNVISWTPIRATIPTTDISSAGIISGWVDDINTPYSVDPGDWYWSGTYSTPYHCDYLATACTDFSIDPSSATNGTHGHVGNYYNWTAVIAINDSSSFNDVDQDTGIPESPQNSICPAGWRLPIVASYDDADIDYHNLIIEYDSSLSDDQNLIVNPAYFVRGGSVSSSYDLDDGGILYTAGGIGNYWFGTVISDESAYITEFSGGHISTTYDDSRTVGKTVRCMARNTTPNPTPSGN